MTGYEKWRTKQFPALTAEDGYALQNVIYVIYDRKVVGTIHVGQTSQRLDKRISDHVRKMKYLQKYREFGKKSHKSRIAYRLAVDGTENAGVVPWICFDELIDTTWPTPGSFRFRRYVEEKFEFPIAEQLRTF